MKNLLLLAAPLILFVGANGPAAQAAQAEENRTRIVRSADLDLKSEAGRGELDRRLRVAIHEVCGIASDVDLKAAADVRRCRTAARQAAADQVRDALAAGQQFAQIAVTNR